LPPEDDPPLRRRDVVVPDLVRVPLLLLAVALARLVLALPVLVAPVLVAPALVRLVLVRLPVLVPVCALLVVLVVRDCLRLAGFFSACFFSGERDGLLRLADTDGYPLTPVSHFSRKDTGTG